VYLYKYEASHSTRILQLQFTIPPVTSTFLTHADTLSPYSRHNWRVRQYSKHFVREKRDSNFKCHIGPCPILHISILHPAKYFPLRVSGYL